MQEAHFADEGGYPIQSWTGGIPPIPGLDGGTPFCWWGVPPGMNRGYHILLMGGTLEPPPHPDLGWGTPLQQNGVPPVWTWDGVLPSVNRLKILSSLILQMLVVNIKAVQVLPSSSFTPFTPFSPFAPFIPLQSFHLLLSLFHLCSLCSPNRILVPHHLGREKGAREVKEVKGSKVGGWRGVKGAKGAKGSKGKKGEWR